MLIIRTSRKGEEMRVNGTIHKRNFTGKGEWYFVEELACDTLFGLCVPNDRYIESYGKSLLSSEIKSWFTENATVTGELIWYTDEEHPYKKNFTYINIEKLTMEE